MYKKVIVLLTVLLTFASFSFADNTFVQSDFYSVGTRQPLIEQLDITTSETEPKSDSVLLAVANPDYRVTYGDVYTLTYYDAASATSSKVVSQRLQVDSQGNINIPYLGKTKAQGYTYVEFKNKVESELRVNYSYLRAQIDLTSCGTFEVYVYGEVESALNVKCWSMTRLSDLCQYATKYASTRNVYVTYSNGTTCFYDLYAALKQNSTENNPFLEPGCKVRFVQAEKTVFVKGSVKHPGQYQVNGSDTLEDVIKSYSGDFDFYAEKGFVTVVNIENSKYVAKEIKTEEFESYELRDMDTIYVSGIQKARPFVTVQGAIQTEANATQGGKFNYEFVEGETAEQLVRSIKSSLLANSDTSAIYLERDGQRYSIDSNIVFTTTDCGTTVLQQGDIIVIPYLQQYVTVSGGVSKPGNYMYEPDKGVDYYINLAGGYSTDAIESSLKILDSSGSVVKTQDSLLPNYTINIRRRNTNAASTIAIGISLATLGVAIYSAIN